VSKVPVVLVVEDEDDTRELLGHLLNHQIGCVVEEARHGIDAMDFLRDPEKPLPCVILLDWMMPKMNGAATLTELASDPMLATIPVIVCTAAPLEEAPGAVVVLRKPFSLTRLVALVREHCERARTAPSPAHDDAATSRQESNE
jgi:CheY-like chemotaxis protein